MMAIQWTWNCTWNNVHMLPSEQIISIKFTSFNQLLYIIDWIFQNGCVSTRLPNKRIHFLHRMYSIHFFLSVHAWTLHNAQCTWHRDSDDSLSMSHINNRVVKIRRTALKIAYDWKLEGWQCLPCKHTVNVCYRIVMTMWNEIVSQYNTRFIYRAQRRPSTTHTLKSYRINTLAATSSTLSHSQMLN